MLAFIVRRILYMVPMLAVISVISFIVIQAPPGDFLTSQMQQLREQYASGADVMIETLRERYGLGQPMYLQYYRWVSGIILRGDFGQSFEENRPVREMIANRMPLTVWLSVVTLLFTWLIGVPIGVLSAVKQHTPFDYVFTFFAFIGRSIPDFLLALILMFLFYENFGWRLGGLFSQHYQEAAWSIGKFIDMMRHLLVPIIVIGTAGTAGIVRVLRGMMLDEFGKQYVQTARAKGLSETVVIWKHVMKVAILPIISTIGWVLPQIVSGAVIVSIVLNLPTTGQTMFRALQSQDMFVAGAFVLLLSTLTLIGTLLSDILLAVIDPRIRYE